MSTAKAKHRPVAPCRSRPWKSHLVAVAALWLLILAAYSDSFTAGLVGDNGPLIRDDVRVHSADARSLHLILGQHYWFGNGESNLYRPITTLSFLFNYAILGNGPVESGYHGVNLAIHAVNAVLLYVLALWLFRRIADAWLMTAIWAVHPVLTESVTNIVGRADLLAGFAVFAGLICHVRAAKGDGRRAWWLAALFAVVAIGMFSKENAVVVLGVMALWDLLIDRPPAWQSRLWNYAVAAAPCLVFLYVRGRIIARSLAYFVPFTDNPLASADFWTARLTAVKVIGKYLRVLIWPAALSSDYSYNEIPLFSWRFNTLEDWKTPLALLVCLALAGAIIYCRRRNPKLSFFIGLFFVTLAPTANLAIIIGTPMAERFLYIPAVAMAGCAVIAVRRLCEHLRKEPSGARLVAASLSILILIFAARTYARNKDWNSDGSLMAADAESAPNSFKPHMALAVLSNDPQRAIAEAARTHQILDGLPDRDNSMKSYTNLGICYRNEGDRAAADPARQSAAEGWYRKSLQDLLRARAIEQAVNSRMQRENQLRGTGKLDFGWFPVYLELGRTYLRLSQPAEALEALQHGRLLEFRPDFFEEMSRAFRAMGDNRRAAIVLMEGLTMDPGQTQLATQLADLYSRTDPQSCALRENGGVRSLNMDCPLVKEEFCAAMSHAAGLYSQVGRSREAARTEQVRVSQIGCPVE